MSKLNAWNHFLVLSLAFSESNDEMRRVQGTDQQQTPIARSWERGNAQEPADSCVVF